MINYTKYAESKQYNFKFPCILNLNLIFFFRLQGLLKKYFKKKRRESRGLFVRHTYTIDFTGLREKYMAKGVCGAR